MTAVQSRPRQRLSADARRQQLECAAIQIIGRQGLPAATAESIARSAGVSKGLLWRYYADLDDLMLHAGRRALSLLEAAVATDTDTAAEAPALFTHAIHRAARLPSTHPCELRAIRQIALSLRPRDERTTLRDNEYRALYARQAELLQLGQDQGHLRTDLTPHLVAVIYQGMVDAMLDHLDANPDTDPLTYADHVAAVLLAGITKPSSSSPPPA